MCFVNVCTDGAGFFMGYSFFSPKCMKSKNSFCFDWIKVGQTQYSQPAAMLSSFLHDFKNKYISQEGFKYINFFVVNLHRDRETYISFANWIGANCEVIRDKNDTVVAIKISLNNGCVIVFHDVVNVFGGEVPGIYHLHLGLEEGCSLPQEFSDVFGLYLDVVEDNISLAGVIGEVPRVSDLDYIKHTCEEFRVNNFWK